MSRITEIHEAIAKSERIVEAYALYSDWNTASETTWRRAGGLYGEYTTSDVFWMGASFPNDLSSYTVDYDSIIVDTPEGASIRFYAVGV